MYYYCYFISYRFCYYIPKGYDTHLFHIYYGTYYSKYNSYKNLVFHTFIPLEFIDISWWIIFGWPKDIVLTNQIKSALTSSLTSDLVFAFSVQVHGVYANYYMDNLEIRVYRDTNYYNNKNS